MEQCALLHFQSFDIYMFSFQDGLPQSLPLCSVFVNSVIHSEFKVKSFLFVLLACLPVDVVIFNSNPSHFVLHIYSLADSVVSR